jgi:hypothetical protein
LTDHITFISDGGNLEVALQPTLIGVVSGGIGDPLAGNYQTIYVPAHTSYASILIGPSASGSSVRNINSSDDLTSLGTSPT